LIIANRVTKQEMNLQEGVARSNGSSSRRGVSVVAADTATL
jgi:hypothetical protein